MDNIQRPLWSDDDLIPPKEAAIFLGGKSKPLALSTLTYWRLRGVGPKYIRIGGSIRYRVSSLKNFMLIEEKP
jgi:hypothetical protein